MEMFIQDKLDPYIGSIDDIRTDLMEENAVGSESVWPPFIY